MVQYLQGITTHIMPTRSVKLYSLALLLGDFFTLLAAFSLAYYLRTQIDHRPLVYDVYAVDFLLTSLIIIPLWIAVFFALGMYRSSVYNKRLTEYGKLFMGCVIGILIVIGYAYAVDEPIFPARLVPVYAFFAALILLLFERELLRQLRNLMYRYGYGIRRVLLIGTSGAVADIATHIGDTRHSGYRVVAIAAPRRVLPKAFDGHHYAVATNALNDLEKMRITTIVQTDLYDSAERNQTILRAAQALHISYNFIPGEPEFYSGKNTIDVFLGYPVISVHQTPLVGWGVVVKRIFDSIISFLLILLLSPLLLVVTALQKLFNPGPILYVSRRLTQFGKPFGIFKFRSMNAKFGDKDAAEDFRAMGREDLALEYEKHRKVTKDPRITKLGAFLRATSIDELPQLFNVLRGDMSLVGPRPILPQELERYRSLGRGSVLHSVKPGITGLWQIAGRNEISFEKRIELEQYYAQNWSFWLDVKILFKTLGVLIKKTGAR
jgi:exopolysaccharide biosynthesis polyprenyl glycosylphosphotransferase